MFKVGDRVKRKLEELKSGQWRDVENNTGIFTVSAISDDGVNVSFKEDHRKWRSNRFIPFIELEYI